MDSLKILKMPKCPICGRPQMFPKHPRCGFSKIKEPAKLFICSRSGVVSCDTCDAMWMFSSIEHECLCGTIFLGGEYWDGMKLEWGRIKNLKWIKEIGLTKKLMTSRIINKNNYLFNFGFVLKMNSIKDCIGLKWFSINNHIRREM